jgi:hypothetical protein
MALALLSVRIVELFEGLDEARVSHHGVWDVRLSHVLRMRLPCGWAIALNMRVTKYSRIRGYV